MIPPENQSELSCSDDIPDMEEDFKIKEEILLSNPSLRPTLEIFEIEFKNIENERKKPKYPDSKYQEEDFSVKERNIILIKLTWINIARI